MRKKMLSTILKLTPQQADGLELILKVMGIIDGVIKSITEKDRLRIESIKIEDDIDYSDMLWLVIILKFGIALYNVMAGKKYALMYSTRIKMLYIK